jgi:hypothetical protein
MRWLWLEEAGDFILALIFVLVRPPDRLNPGYGAEARGAGGDARRLEIDRQLFHLFPARTELVAEFTAVANREGDRDVRAGVGADHQEVRLAESGHELAEAAALAQVGVAHGCAVLHIELAHGSCFLIRNTGRLLAGEQGGDGVFRCSATELPGVPRVGIEPTTNGFEVSVTYATGQGGIQKTNWVRLRRGMSDESSEPLLCGDPQGELSGRAPLNPALFVRQWK